MQLGQRRLHDGGAADGPLVGTLVKHATSRFQAEFHVDDPAGHQLELADRLAKLFAFPGVTDAGLQQALHGADGTRENAAALPRHRSG